MNEYLIFLSLIICLLYYYINDKYFNEKEKTTMLATTNILTLILSFKYIKLSNFIINSNIVIYCFMFITICMLLENSSKKKVNKKINMIFFINIICSFMLYLLTLYTQSINDTASINILNVFNSNYKVLIIYPITMLISQKLLVLIYKKTKNIYENLFISMTTTYLAVGLIESILYSLLCYYNELNNQIIIKIILSNYMPRLIIIVLFSLILTIYNKKKVKK